MITFNMSRSASYFESGIGRGMGFRDSNSGPAWFCTSRSLSGRVSGFWIWPATQLETGGAYHQYQPLTKRGNNDVGSGFNDDPAVAGAWRVTAYVKETGDWSILDEQVPTTTKPGI